jgi:predicted nucleic acid-binding Zn ribbon protein
MLQTEPAKPRPEVIPVPIWRCKDKGCKAWIREEMAESASPDCPICKGAMIRSMKHLPKLVKKYKAPSQSST